MGGTMETTVQDSDTEQFLDTMEEADSEENGLVEESPDPVTNGEEETEETEMTERQGTTASARFNILSTMVGGGSLSLPMAFQQAGNGLLGPLLLLIVAVITEFCFKILVDSARTVSPVSLDQRTPGKDSFESVASAAFGPKANLFCMGLVTSMCFFGVVGYCVLLRDMLMPIAELVFADHSLPDGPTVKNNSVMLSVVLLVTPLCTLKTLTALKRFGAASMLSVLILGACVLFRSLECNWNDVTWSDAFQLWPDSWKEVLDAFPLFISCYVCHYNLLTVHNELRRPSPERVSWWLSSTTWTATAFYMMIGLAGSAYGHCTKTGKVQGNVLLDFDDDDPLLLIGRMCLALTISLAFPMLTIPARDILIRALPSKREATTMMPQSDPTIAPASPDVMEPSDMEALREPLLENQVEANGHHSDDTSEEPCSNDTSALQDAKPSASFGLRLIVAISVFWSGAAVASCVASIDVVWDLLGSSLSILLSQLIPCASYLVISKRAANEDGETNSSWRRQRNVAVAWLLIVIFTPLMFLSTANAIRNTFFLDE